MDCPACGLVNPPSAARCDCGYGFADGGPAAPPRAPRAGSGTVMVGAGLVFVGLVITVVSYSSASGGGGRFVLMYGPVIAGISMIIRGLIKRGA